jgi:hypothetical protein
MSDEDPIEDYWRVVRPIRKPSEDGSTDPKRASEFPLEGKPTPNYILRANSDGVFEWIPVRGIFYG